MYCHYGTWAHLFHVALEVFHRGGFKHSCGEETGPGSDGGLGSATLEGSWSQAYCCLWGRQAKGDKC